METHICNDSTKSLSTITVFYDGEQWRTGSTSNNVNNLVLQYSADGVNYVNMGAAFNFIQPTLTPLNSARDGNAAANRTANRGGTFPLASPLPPGGTLFLRWFDADNTGTDPALAIDNFSFSACETVCATNKTVECGSSWNFNPPTSSCSNATITALSTTTNGTCPMLIMRTWSVSFPSGQSNSCSQTVTVVDTTPPVFTNCPACGTWTETGALNTARAWHTATLLPNGKVLVAGGVNNGGNLSSAELYDIATGTWTATGSLNTGRRFHTATLLPNGKVLVAGGYNNSGYGYLSSAEVYDPATGTWAVTAPLNTGRYFHTATLLPNGKVLVAGGEGFGTVSSAELYDPTTGTWAPTGALVTPRGSHTAALLPNGKVLLRTSLIS